MLGQDFHPAAGSAAIGAPGTLAPDAASHPVLWEYVEHQSAKDQVDDGIRTPGRSRI